MNLSTDATDPPLGTDIDVDVLFLEMTTRRRGRRYRRRARESTLSR